MGYRYKRIDGQLVKKTAEEWKAIDEANKPEPSAEEQIASLQLELDNNDWKRQKYTRETTLLAVGTITERSLSDEDYIAYELEMEDIVSQIRGLQ